MTRTEEGKKIASEKADDGGRLRSRGRIVHRRKQMMMIACVCGEFDMCVVRNAF